MAAQTCALQSPARFHADRLHALVEAHGPETVAFSNASPSTSALDDSVAWLRRFRRAFGSPNNSISMELCGWGRWLANIYSYGTALPAGVMPDLENAGCILYWGYNPSVSRIAHATATVAATKRGAKLIVVDPLLAQVSTPGIILLATGGLLYSLGVVFHLWACLPYHNAIWHSFVLAAVACHFAAVLSEIAIAA